MSIDDVARQPRSRPRGRVDGVHPSDAQLVSAGPSIPILGAPSRTHLILPATGRRRVRWPAFGTWTSGAGRGEHSKRRRRPWLIWFTAKRTCLISQACKPLLRNENIGWLTSEADLL